MADWLRELIRSRRRVFRTDGFRSSRWKCIKKSTSDKVKRRRKKANDFIIEKLDESNPGKFFGHLDKLLGKIEEKRWSPSQIYPEKSDGEVAEIFADFLNQISSHYPKLDREKIPPTHSEPLPILTCEDVAKRIKQAKKLTSTVPGDHTQKD